MIRSLNRLTALKVSKQTGKGLYADGGGLFLQVSASGTKSWIFRYALKGKTTAMGLGPLPTVSLAEAREKALLCRKQLLDGLDPLRERQSTRQARDVAAAKMLTFQECADRYIATHSPAWRNAKHKWQWESSLRNVAGAVFGELPVDAVDTGLVLAVLEPIWQKKHETASRLRGRIEAVIDWASAHGLRSQQLNPARWKGHLDHLLPPVSRLHRIVHLPAMPYADVPTFLEELKNHAGNSPLALELAILTACRTREIIGAQHSEVDRANLVWVIPAERMKAGVEHRVPLTPRMLAIFDEMALLAQSNPFVFRNPKGKPISNMAMLMLLRKMGYDDYTVHGFRSSFRDWIRECTDHPREVAEVALAHTLVNKVEAAYARGDILEKRRLLMSDWEAYCLRKTAPVAG
jgi:integrase